MMKKLLAFALFLYPVSSGMAQEFRIDTVQDVSPFESETTYSFPFLHHDKREIVSDSINRDLIHVFLDIEIGKEHESIFENVWGSEEQPFPVLSDISFEVLRNDTQFFSIGISAEGCGAYCEYFTEYFNYDSRTGRPIEIADLFTSKGIILLCDSLLTEKRRTIENHLAVLRNRDNRQELEYAEYFDDQKYLNVTLRLYENCLQRSDTLYAEYLRFSMNPLTMSIWLSRCSAHWNLPYDALWDFEYEIDLLDWKNHLSEYGKSFLNVESTRPGTKRSLYQAPSMPSLRSGSESKAELHLRERM